GAKRAFAGLRQRSDQAQEQVARVAPPARQTTADGAVDADVLQVVPGMLLDEPDRAFGAERQHTVLDELRDALVMALDDLEHPRLGPPVELLAKILVGGQRPAGALESFHDPDAHFGARPLEVGQKNP